MEGSEEDEDQPRYGPVGATSRRAELESWHLTLSALAIPHLAVPGDGGEWALFVAEVDTARAREAISQTSAESRLRKVRATQARRDAEGKLSFTPGLLFAAALLVIAGFAGVGGLRWHGRWFLVGANVLPLTRGGQWWRAITALTLHASWTHLAVNATCGLLMLPLACELWGSGFGIFLTLVSGALANWSEAMLGGNWSSLGASTALFGALGIAFGTRLLRKGSSRKEIWAICIVSVLLFGMFGLGGAPLPGGSSGPPVDVSAHALGLVFGLLLGGAARLGLRHRPGRRAQWLLGGLSTAVVACAWLWAFRPR